MIKNHKFKKITEYQRLHQTNQFFPTKTNLNFYSMPPFNTFDFDELKAILICLVIKLIRMIHDQISRLFLLTIETLVKNFNEKLSDWNEKLKSRNLHRFILLCKWQVTIHILSNFRIFYEWNSAWLQYWTH